MRLSRGNNVVDRISAVRIFCYSYTRDVTMEAETKILIRSFEVSKHFDLPDSIFKQTSFYYLVKSSRHETFVKRNLICQFS